MPNEHNIQGHGGRDSHPHQPPHRVVMSSGAERSHPFTSQPSSSLLRFAAQQEQRNLAHNDPSHHTYVSLDRDGRVQQPQHQQLYIEPDHPALRQEEKIVYTHQAASSISQGRGASPGPSSSGLDGQSLYCTEVLPSASPPSQPITVEGGGTSRRGLVAVNGGAGNQPIQYTIIIADPQIQHPSSGSNNIPGTTNILLSTLVQQQQQLQQQQQQQLQQHIASISKANKSDINNVLKSPGVVQTNANLLVNNKNVNGSNSKLNSLLTNSSNSVHNNKDKGEVTGIPNSRVSSGSSRVTSSTFPTTLSTVSSAVGSESRAITVSTANQALNNRLSSAVIDGAGLEGGIVILNYADHPQLRAGAITSISQLVTLHSRPTDSGHVVGTLGHSISSNSHIARQGNDISSVLSTNDKEKPGLSQAAVLFKTSDSSQHTDLQGNVDTRGLAAYSRHVLENKESAGSLDSHNNSSSSSSRTSLSSHSSHSSRTSQILPCVEQLEPGSPSEKLSGGMHSGRTGAGSAQAHSSLPQQQQQPHSPSNSSSTASADSVGPTSNQAAAAMLSAGPPAVPSGIFRTGADNSSTSHRLSGSGSASYVPAQYSTIYGLHGQSPSHLTAVQPYAFFPAAFGGSGASGHGFSSHSSMMPVTSPGHYPHIESYSAMLASMGSQVQHRGAPGSERSPRVQAPGVSVPQRPGTFLPAAHMAAPGSPYIPSSSHRRLSGSSPPSPGTAAASHTSTARMEPLPSHHLEKMAAIKGGHQSREGDATTRDLRLYGDSSSLHEDKPSLSPTGAYPASGHVPKVSFDTVVKEYGGGRDSPTGRGEPRDVHFRTSLSGKEGSLKHRILTRPSDSDAGDDFSSKVSGIQGLKDEPVAKRPKFASVGSASLSYSSQTAASGGHANDSQRAGGRHHSLAHAASHHPSNNGGGSGGVDSRGSSGAHHPDSGVGGYQGQTPSSYQHHTGEEDSAGDRFKHHHHQQAYHASPSPSSPTPGSENPPSHLQYPSHFMKGSIIQLANGSLKRVEDLQTEDFVNSAEISADLKVDSSTVVRIEEHQERGTAMLSFSVGEHRVQVTVEATLEHPFFVFGQGWSSCSVSRTLARYGLDCQKLNVGDVCISLTHKDVNLKAAEISQQQQQHQQQQQSYGVDQHNSKQDMTSATTSSHQIPHLSTSSSGAPASSSPPNSSSSTLSSSLKEENTDSNFLPPPAASSGKRKLSQTDLPPPLSNIVPVKKENNNNNNNNNTNNNNNHSSRRRAPPRGEGEVKEEEEVIGEEEDDSDSTSALRKRRWSAPDPVSVKAEQERERERQKLADEAQKAEETSLGGGGDYARQ